MERITQQMESLIGTNNHAPTSRNSTDPQKRRIADAVGDCAVLRGGTATKDQLRLYPLVLAKEPLEDVLATLDKLGTMERAEYEPALPECPAIVAMVRTCTQARINRAESARDLELVGWRCRACHGTVSDYFPKARNVREEVRYCQRPARQVRVGANSGEICGGNLDVIHCEAVCEGAA